MARTFVAAIALLAAVAAVAQAQCQVAAGGQVFDLSKANNGNDVTVAMGSTGYNAIINSCKGIATPDQIICQSGCLACQKAASTGAAFKNMARQITTSTYNGATLVVTYDNGDNCPNATPPVNRKVVISYTCNQSPPSGNPTYVNENPSCQYNFNWASPAGCGAAGTVAPTAQPTLPGGGSGGLSGGDVFLIIFFVGGFLYVAIGMAYMYKFKGQTGVEMVPNIQFWRDLPGLLKDGFVYSGQKISGLFQKS